MTDAIDVFSVVPAFDSAAHAGSSTAILRRSRPAGRERSSRHAPPRLAIVGPPALADAVVGALRRNGRDGHRVRIVACLDWPDRGNQKLDGPFDRSIARLTERAHQDIDTLLVIAPLRSTPRSVVAAPVVRGLPIGVVFADGVADLDAWLATLRTTVAPCSRPRSWVLLAEWEQRYLSRARRQARAIRAMCPPSGVARDPSVRGSGRRVRTWLACDLNGIDLLARLDAGAHWVAYHGHANPQGLSGYFGVTAQHLLERIDAKPIGTFVCWACRSLQRERSQKPFGVELVRHGRVASFFGSIESISSVANGTLSALADSILTQGPPNVSAFLRRLDDAVAARHDRELDRVWRSYRLVGNPIEALG